MGEGGIWQELQINLNQTAKIGVTATETELSDYQMQIHEGPVQPLPSLMLVEWATAVTLLFDHCGGGAWRGVPIIQMKSR